MSSHLLAQTLPQWLEHNAAVRAQEVGQRHKCDGIWREFHWQQIADEVRALAFGLAARHVQRGDTVLLISESEIGALAALAELPVLSTRPALRRPSKAPE